MSLRTWYNKIMHGENTAALTTVRVSAEDTNGTETMAKAPCMTAASAKAGTINGPVTVADKDELVRRFRQWLDERPAELAEVADSDNTSIDLYSVFAELIALKNEVKHESRQFKGAFDEYQKALAIIENSNRLAQSELEARKQGERGIRELVTRALLLEILEIRDRLVDGAQALARLKPKMLRRKYRKQQSLATGLLDGQRMVLERIDKLLLSHGATPIAAAGKPFDPHTMRAVEVVSDSGHRHGEVMAEIRSGFFFNGEVLRHVEVVVNKLASTPAETLE